MPLKKSVRVLGIRLDRHLNFVDHFNEVKRNCQTRINLLRTLSRKHLANNRAIRMRVAKAVIDSRLTYGIELTCLATDRLITQLTSVYYQALRITSGLLPSTPGLAACIESGRMPFNKFIVATVCMRAISFLEKTTGTNKGVSLLIEANKLLKDSANLELPPVAEVHWCGARGWNLPRPYIDLAIKNRFRAGTNSPALVRSVAELQQTKYRYHQIRFTDGSRSGGKVGFGIHDTELATSLRLPDPCSVFSAEAAAIYVAATLPADKPIAIFTDSASVLTALQSDTAKHPWIQDIQRSSPNGTAFIWIPGHCGVSGNEKADFLAASGRQSNLYTHEIPAQDLKRWIKTMMWKCWTDEWLRSRDLFIRKIKSDTRKWNDPSEHRSQVVISRMRTGHTRASHNMGSGGPFRKQCEVCNIPHTVEHFLCECPRYQASRELCGIRGNVGNILKDDAPSIAAVLWFLRETGLENQI